MKQGLTFAGIFFLLLLIMKTMKSKVMIMYPAKKMFPVSSAFGNRINPVTKVNEFHSGVDFAMPEGTELFAPDSAVVSVIREDAKGGKQIVLQHPNNIMTGYAHLSKIMVKKGDTLKQGDLFALTGKTGAVSGSHLHMTAYVNNEKVNPLTIIKT